MYTDKKNGQNMHYYRELSKKRFTHSWRQFSFFFLIWMQDTLTFSEPWPKEEAAHI